MSAFDIVAALRQQKFPDCTRMAIEKLATIYLHGGTTTIPGLASGADDLEEQIVAEFITFKNTKKVLQQNSFTFFADHACQAVNNGC